MCGFPLLQETSNVLCLLNNIQFLEKVESRIWWKQIKIKFDLLQKNKKCFDICKIALSSHSERLKQFEGWASITEDSKPLESERCLETMLVEMAFFWIYIFNKGAHAWKICKTHFIARNASAGLIFCVTCSSDTHLCTAIISFNSNFPTTPLSCWLRKAPLQLHAGDVFKSHLFAFTLVRIRRKEKLF